MKVVSLTENSKLGTSVAATYNNVTDSCPTSCKLMNNGCYAQKGFPRLWSDRSKTSSDKLNEIYKSVKMVRLNVTGDLLKNGNVDWDLIDEIISFAKSRSDTKIWGYTHAWKQIGENPFSKIPNIHFFASIDLGEEDIVQSDIELSAKLGYNYARVIKSEKTKKKDEVLCPFDKQKKLGKKVREIDVSCSTCKLCFSAKRNIAFIKF